ncbi:TPA: hypothetical protein CPT87_01410 [Candidatus Gastranaerophilales bacterium HUM_5]|nr:MAG TPA: hypothetical protein CPT99_03260 [Candidatus Gastranaerophilales bacterium HUM_4]DAA92537.1 MAG TPA: hypothetical protein CPT87_01410 [Candidatus Gastranaerophilales bacterium HUM_5]
MNKLVSIIMPVKNGNNYMREAIYSIKNQKVNSEIIVVDDGSTDNTFDIAEKLGCKVIKHEINKGQVAAKNTGLKNAQGNFIIFCDHDDLLEPNALKTMLEEFEQDIDLMVVNAKIIDFISPDAKNLTRSIKTEPYYGCIGGSMLIKKEVFDKIGLFDASVQAGEVIALTSNFAKHRIKVKKIDFVSSKRRIHDTNYGVMNSRNEFKDYAALLRAKLRK